VRIVLEHAHDRFGDVHGGLATHQTFAADLQRAFERDPVLLLLLDRGRSFERAGAAVDRDRPR